MVCTSVATELGNPNYPGHLGHLLSRLNWALLAAGHTCMPDLDQNYSVMKTSTKRLILSNRTVTNIS